MLHSGKPVSREQEQELFTFEQQVLGRMMKKKDEKNRDEQLLNMIAEQCVVETLSQKLTLVNGFVSNLLNFQLFCRIDDS